MTIPPLHLGVVETIYEDEENSSNNSPSSVSPTNSSCIATLRTAPHEHYQLCFPSPPLRRRVHAWCQATGRPTDVVIRVGNRSFDLHKSILVARSGYMKRHLSDSTQISLEQDSLITPEAFDLIASFCYGTEITLTAFNMSALLCAAEFLEMTDEHDVAKVDLCQKIDAFLSKAIMPHRENILAVLHSSLPLLPHSEHLLRTCIEGLTAMDDCHGILDWKDDVVSLPASTFFRVMDSMKASTHNHDIIYEVIRLYIKEHPDLAEAERNQIYGFLDCNKVSLDTLIQVVRNPEVPLRLTIHAMFIQQLKARDTIQKISSSVGKNRVSKPSVDNDSLSFGEILRRDATLREAMELRAEMEATCLRIKDLEEDLSSLKREIKEREKHQNHNLNIIVTGSERYCDSDLQENKPFSKFVFKGLRTILRKSKHGLEYGTAETLQDHLDGLIAERHEGTMIKGGLTHRRSRSFA